MRTLLNTKAPTRGPTTSTENHKMKWEVYDVNTGETIHTFKTRLYAVQCAMDMNLGHLDKLYRVRKPSPEDIFEAWADGMNDLETGAHK